MLTDIKKLVDERLAILAIPPAPKPKPRHEFYIVESRDWIAVYFEHWTGNLYRKYPRTYFDVEEVKFYLENDGHFVTIG